MEFLVKNNQKKLKISMTAGDVIIQGEERENIELDFGDLSKQGIEKYFDINDTEDTLQIKEIKKHLLNFSSGKFLNFKSRPEMKLIVKVPNSMQIDGETVLYAGDMECSNIKSNSTIKLYAGDLEVSNIDFLGNTDLHLMAGDFKSTDSSGSFNCKLMAGDIKCKDCYYKNINIKSTAGDVSLTGKFFLENNGTIKSMAGDINIKADEKDEALEITADKSALEENKKVLYIKTAAGDIRINGENVDKKSDFSFNFGNKFKDFDKKFKNFDKNFNLDLDLSNIGNFLKENLSGVLKKNKDDIWVEKNQNTVSKEENIDRVLKMLEEGKISADEAEKLIKSL